MPLEIVTCLGLCSACESHHVIMSWLSNCTGAKSVIPKIHLWSTRNSPDDYKMELSELSWEKQSRGGEVLRNSFCTSCIIENKRTLNSAGPWLIKELHYPKSIWVCIWNLKQYSIKKRIHEWCCAQDQAMLFLKIYFTSTFIRWLHYWFLNLFNLWPCQWLLGEGDSLMWLHTIILPERESSGYISQALSSQK